MGAAKVPLFAMYKYDPSILNDIILPEGIDKQLFINELLLSCGEFGVIYTDPGFLKFAVAHWANKWNHTFAEWLKGITAEYNPIYNYDRYEESTDTDSKTSRYKTEAEYDANRTGSENSSGSSSNTETINKTGTDYRTTNLTDLNTQNLSDARNTTYDSTVNISGTDTSTQLIDGEVEHTVSAYDSSVYQPASKDVTNIGSSQISKTGQTITDDDTAETIYHTGTDETTHTGTDNHDTSESGTVSNSGSDSNQSSSSDRLHTEGTLSDVTGSESNEHTHELHNYGNIGVTTAPAMLKEFYNISSWNLIDHMVELFKVEFLILTY